MPEAERRAYESDGLTAYRQLPLLVVLPSSTAEVAAVLHYCRGRGRQGGAARRRHLAVGRRAAAGRRRPARHGQVQPHPRDRLRQSLRRGAAGRHQSRHHHAVAGAGFYYAPDPSSQIACTIGGNVAENSGGVHCLKYGLTTNNVLGVEMVLIERRGGPPRRQASRCRGLRSAGRDDRLGRSARRRHRGDGAHPATSPTTARALLIGFPANRERRRLRRRDHRRRHHSGRHGDDGQAGDPRRRGLRPCRLSARCRGAADRRARRAAGRGRPSDRAGRGDRHDRHGAASLPRQRATRPSGCAFWAGRKAAFPAVGRISPDYYCMDGTIPRDAPARGADAHARARRSSMGCASPMSSMPATAICTR